MRSSHTRRSRMAGFLVAGVLLVAQAAPSASEERAADGIGSEGTEGEGAAVGESSLPPPPPGVEILVVTGQRRRASVADASQAATTFDAVELEALGVVDIGDLAASTPSLEIRKTGSTTATFFIRGVGLNDFTANASGSVAIYMDDVPLNLPAVQSGLIYDVQDVQVLKGPQGAGPGRNASAGAIKTVSRKPTGEFASSLRFDYGNFNFIDAEGALEVPLVEDVLSTRMSFRLTQRDGIVENRCGGLTQAEIDAAGGSPCGNQRGATIFPGLPEQLNDKGIWAARAHLRFVPPDTDMDWTLSVHGGKIDQLGTVGQHLGAQRFLGSKDLLSYRAQEVEKEAAAIRDQIPGTLDPFAPGIPPQKSCLPPNPRNPDRGPNSPECLERRRVLTLSEDTLAQSLADRPLDTEPFAGDYNFPGFERMSSYGGFLRGEWELPRVSLTSISGFERYVRDRNVDADYSPNTLFEFVIEDDAWQFSQDLQASGELDRLPVSWGSGGYFLMEELAFSQSTRSGGSVSRVDQDYVQKTWSLGIYADFSWEFLDDFTLDAGVRYNWERKSMEAEIFRSPIHSCEPLPGGKLIPDCDVTATFGAPTGTVGLTYDFNDAVSAYWKYSRGWKGAQLNARDGNPRSRVLDVALPETIDAFEVGFKGLWLDDRLSLEGAAFWYNYDDYQVFVVTNDIESPPQRVVINANDAQIYGAELEASLEPVEALLLRLRFGWVESKFLDFTDTGTRAGEFDIDSDQGQTLFFQQVIDYNGNRLPNTPRFKLSGNATYTFDLGRFGELVTGYDFSWIDDIFFDPSEGRGAPNIGNEIILPELTIGQAAYAIHNARITYRAPSGNLSVAAWVRNFTDEIYKSTAFDLSAAANMVGSLVGNPRTYGVSAKVEF